MIAFRIVTDSFHRDQDGLVWFDVIANFNVTKIFNSIVVFFNAFSSIVYIKKHAYG